VEGAAEEGAAAADADVEDGAVVAETKRKLQSNKALLNLLTQHRMQLREAAVAVGVAGAEAEAEVVAVQRHRRERWMRVQRNLFRERQRPRLLLRQLLRRQAHNRRRNSCREDRARSN